jgi:hypothetical protein
MYLQRLAVLADELRNAEKLGPSRFLTLLESRADIAGRGPFSRITVEAAESEGSAGVLRSLMRSLGYRTEHNVSASALTVARQGVPALVTILLPQDASSIIRSVVVSARRAGYRSGGLTLRRASEALTGDREVAGKVALRVLMETLGDREVADILGEIHRLKADFREAAREVLGL